MNGFITVRRRCRQAIVIGVVALSAGRACAQNAASSSTSLQPEPPSAAELRVVTGETAPDAEQIALQQPDSAAELPPVVKSTTARDSAELIAPPVPLDLVEFRELPLTDAMRVFSDQSGLNIVPSSAAAQVSVSMHLRNTDAISALDALTKTHGLYYRQDRGSGIIRIYTTEEYQADLGSFREEKTEVFTLLYPNPVDVAVAIQGLFGTRVQLSLGANDFLSIQDLSQRFGRYSLLEQFNQGFGNNGGGFGNGSGNFGTGIGSFGGGFGNQFGGGGGFGNQFGGGGFGNQFGGGMGNQFGGGFTGGAAGFGSVNPALTQQTLQQPLENLTAEQIQQLEQARTSATPEGQAAIDELLRSRNAQIYVTVIRRNNQIVVRTGDEQMMQRIRELIQQLDVPTPLVLLEVKVMSLDLGDRFTSVFDYEFSDGNTIAGKFTAGNILAPANDLLAPDAARAAPLDIANSTFPVAAFGTQSDRDLTFQFVNAHFRARVQLLEDNNRITNLATPLLLTANNEVSRIFIGQTVPITIGFTPNQVIVGGVNNTTVSGVPEIELRDVGQSLLVTPNINADRTVTLRVAQENSRVNAGGGTIPLPNATGGFTNFPVDTVARSTVSGTIVAKDGLAVAIGGLIDEGLLDVREEVPVLGKLPVVGYLFRRQQTNRTRTELVVMIRPYVFNTPSESAALSQDLIESLSLHPNAPQAVGTIGTFNPSEVLRASAPENKLQQILRLHSLYPKTY